MRSVKALAADPRCRSAAGALFERYAHYRLSRGGTFPSIEDPSVKLVLTRRSMHFFNGNSLSVEDATASHRFYLRPNSSSFPVIDSVYLPNVMFQVSTAKKRKPMRKSTYDRLCAELSEYGRAHPEAASGIEGVPTTEPWIVLVKMRGDNSLEEVDPKAPEASEASRSLVSQASDARSSGTQAEAKKTLVKFQATVVLGEDEEDPVDFDYGVELRAVRSKMVGDHDPGHVQFNFDYKLQEIYDTVCSRMVGDHDPGHAQFEDYATSHDLDSDEFVHLVMRRGCSGKQYEELDGDVCVFGVWIKASRSQLADGSYSTVVDMECTRGTFLDEDRELEVFINERVGDELGYYDTVVLHVAPGRPDAAPGSNVTAQLVDATSAKVTILSAERECQYFRLHVHNASDVLSASTQMLP